MSVRLGKKIREFRKVKNLSQEVLAQFLGVSFQAVSKWENDTAMPDISLIPVIASFLAYRQTNYSTTIVWMQSEKSMPFARRLTSAGRANRRSRKQFFERV